MKVTLRGKTYDTEQEPILIVLSDQEKAAFANLDGALEFFGFPSGWSQEDGSRAYQQLMSHLAEDQPSTAEEWDTKQIIEFFAEAFTQAPSEDDLLPPDDAAIADMFSEPKVDMQVGEQIVDGHFEVEQREDRNDL